MYIHSIIPHNSSQLGATYLGPSTYKNLYINHTHNPIFIYHSHATHMCVYVCKYMCVKNMQRKETDTHNMRNICVCVYIHSLPLHMRYGLERQWSLKCIYMICFLSPRHTENTVQNSQPSGKECSTLSPFMLWLNIRRTVGSGLLWIFFSAWNNLRQGV